MDYTLGVEDDLHTNTTRSPVAGRAVKTELQKKFDRKGLTRVGDLDGLNSIVTDTKPTGDLLGAINDAGVKILVAEQSLQRTTNRGQKSHA